MQLTRDIKNIVIALGILGTLAAFCSFLGAQQIIAKVQQFAPGKSIRAQKFQASFHALAFPLAFAGIIQLIGAVWLLVAGLKQYAEILDNVNDCNKKLGDIESQNNLPPIEETDPFLRLAESVNQLTFKMTESRRREKSVIERAVDVICVVNTQGEFITVSKASKHAWGYDSDELTGKSLGSILVSEESDKILQSVLGAANSIDKIIFESRLRKKNGDLIDVVWTAHWSASDGGLFCIVHDITDRKKAENLIKRSEERIRLTFESLPAGVLVLNAQGNMEFANSEAQRLLHMSVEELKLKSLSQIFADQSLRGEGAETLEAVSQKYRHKPMETLAIRNDNSRFPAEVSINGFQIADESRYLAVFMDKTEKHELERLKQEFMAMVSHDLRTPLTAIQGVLTLAEQGILGTLTEKGLKISTKAKKDCDRLLRLINDLLDLEKLEAGMFSLECADMPLNTAVEQAADMIKTIADDAKVSFKIAPGEIRCWADEGRMVQVLVNLMANAIKYSPADSTIDISFEERGDFAKVLVRDHGRGIPADKVGKIFEKFEQVEIADAKQKGGTGLGLAICKAIVAQHGGEIGVDSVFGEGSTFWFSIPKSEKVALARVG